MIEVLIEEVVDQFVDFIDCNNFDFMKWVVFCIFFLVELLVKYCYGKFLGEVINDVGELFEGVFKS